MNRWIKKLHMYFGLLNFSILLVFGIAGLQATLALAPDKRAPPEPKVRLEAYTPPSALDDKGVADDVYRVLKLPLTTPLPKFAIRRDGDKNLTFGFYTVNGPHQVTVLEKEGRLRVETTTNTIWRYFNGLHTMTIQARAQDLRVRMWTWYNEFAVWSLIGMSLSGCYLWLSSRPRYRPAQLVFVAGSGGFVVLYWLTR